SVLVVIAQQFISHNAPAVPGGSGSCVATSRRPVHSIGRRQLHSLVVPCIETILKRVLTNGRRSRHSPYEQSTLGRLVRCGGEGGQKWPFQTGAQTVRAPKPKWGGSVLHMGHPRFAAGYVSPAPHFVSYSIWRHEPLVWER
ncbi:hypothetical protein J6590_105763, partial [Homalodisca vitripennis]